jgi:Domain of unknown function (DUF4124)
MASGWAASVLLWTALLCSTDSAVAATMYRWVDAQGVVHYSDTPQPGAEKIQMESAQTYKAPPVQSSAQANPTAAQKTQTAAYRSCRITAPTADQSFFAPDSVPVVVALEPRLQPGDEVVVTVDGTPLNAAGSDTTNFRLPDPSRGEHTVNFTVQGSDGKAACTAQAVTFNVERPSVLSPQSPARGH